MAQAEADSASTGIEVAPGVRVIAPMRPGYETVLTPDALAFVGLLERRFGAERRRLLTTRADRQDRLDRGELPAFLPETERVRRGNWKVRPAPPTSATAGSRSPARSSGR